ncbi:hypothetical protein [Pseudomonas putida]|uniref:hypothetical protein n=1 Tax=Pseudomonas putida TaxID=303 RepID=UPI0035D43165
MKSVMTPSAKINERAWCRTARRSDNRHANVRLPGANFPALLSEAHRSQTSNCRRCEMNMAIMQQAKSSSSLSRFQPFLPDAPEVMDDIARGFISYTINACFPEVGLNQQIVSVIQRDLAIELVEILRPEFDGARLSITQYAREIEDIDAERLSSSRVKDLVIWLRDSEQPGKDFLTLIGYRGKWEGCFDLNNRHVPRSQL